VLTAVDCECRLCGVHSGDRFFRFGQILLRNSQPVFFGVWRNIPEDEIVKYRKTVNVESFSPTVLFANMRVFSKV